ncbi:4'-phosphopantetheinyl transferase family protein [Pedobacter gandavensis]|uniref:4'-phosphopantetheinyl transferase family protein n=1 Tax=Pedobacter gandavensis TaxID=2679963 RepID=UPI0029316EB8|nr:4'-phosphopantetheinyl transferase superfamily protein [Pedobacter gandavensis]
METAETLLNGAVHWRPYDGQDLSLKDLVQVFKIKASDYFKKIRAEDILSAEELAKAARFLQQQSKENYTVRKYFLRKLLSVFTGIPPTELVFKLMANKKPGMDGLFFNVSHSRDLITIAFSSTDIGIDLEYIDPNFQYQDIMALCFSKEEILLVEMADQPMLAFYLIWTRKEAIIKATGEGIEEQLQTVPSLQRQILRNGTNYQVTSYLATANHLFTTANPAIEKPFVFWDLTTAFTFF